MCRTGDEAVKAGRAIEVEEEEEVVGTKGVSTARFFISFFLFSISSSLLDDFSSSSKSYDNVLPGVMYTDKLLLMLLSRLCG